MKIGPEVPKCYYRVSMKALITNEAGEILVVNERGTGWDLPGGGLDWGEEPVAGLKREIQEELGCEATIHPQPIMIAPSNIDSQNQHVLWIVYRAEVDPAQITATDEVQDTRFMTLDEFQANEEKYDFFDWESPIDFWSELQALIAR
jgi:ADP-ribose pyrophosphatase YjhB (NUDIX family)